MEYSFSFKDIDDLEFKLSEENSNYTFNGVKVPRVTEIISKMIHEDSLLYWANGLGFKHTRYSDEMKKYTTIGSAAHKAIEIFLKKGVIPQNAPYNPITAFISWWNRIISNNKVNVIGQEVPLVCQYYGGTYDLLIKVNDDYWLIDFKTSNHITYKYFLQLAAYNQILRDKDHMNLRGVLVLQLEKTRPIYHEYYLDFARPESKDYFNNCERTFMSLLYGYYNIKYLEKEFSHAYFKTSL